MDTKPDRLIIFTRFPIAGKAKTRLIPQIGAKEAAELQKRMTEFTLQQARKAGAAIEIRYTGATEKQMRAWLGDDYRYIDQGDGDLGARMSRAFDEHFKSGAKCVVIVGSDCPDNRSENMKMCFCALNSHDCVIGPATDGGYYMIGLRRSAPELFKNIDWGTENVLRQTLSATKTTPFMLPILNDVDINEDIPPKISVLIPTLNDAEHIQRTVLKAKDGFNVECIVVDGGSVDGTLELAENAGATISQCVFERNIQMKVGGKLAVGSILFFIYPDTELPDDWDTVIRSSKDCAEITLGQIRFMSRKKISGSNWIEVR